MSNGVLITISFLSGLAIGSFAAWRLLKDKYERIAQEEIDSVKETFAERRNRIKKENAEDDIEESYATEEEDEYVDHTEDYEKVLANNKYVNYREENSDIKPYIIAPEEVGDKDEYEIATLYYYTDGVVADETGNIIENVDEIIGREALKTFGQYEDDCVYVRNDYMECDYEILRSLLKYSEAVNAGPQITEDE